MTNFSNIFELNKKGQLDVTGYVPRCLEKMQLAGSKFKSDYFDPNFQYGKTGLSPTVASAKLPSDFFYQQR